MSELWNHLAGAIVRARIPLVRIPTSRGTRYGGFSHMNFVALVQHGVSAMSVFGDVLFVRLAVGACAMLALAIAIASVSVGIRFFTDLAIPGWTTTVVGISGLAILQALTSVLVAMMMAMSARSTFSFIPRQHAKSFITRVDSIGRHEPRILLRGV
jgi:hypothetical protein